MPLPAVMSPLGLFAILLTALALCQGHWNNDWDGRLNFKCHSDSYAVTSIVSVHNNHREDRRFAIGCTRVGHCSRSSRPSCYWTNWVNSMDHLIHFTCKTNHYINGMSSYHSNHHEDRVWKFRCCSIRHRPLTNCVLSGWTNSWDGWQHFKARYGHVLKGVVSIHNNHREDRLYEYLVCKMGGRREVRKTTLLDYLMQNSQDESEEESMEVTHNYNLGLESKAESEEDPREMTLGDFSKEESEEDPREITIDYFSKDESEEESKETTLRYRPE